MRNFVNVRVAASRPNAAIAQSLIAPPPPLPELLAGGETEGKGVVPLLLLDDELELEELLEDELELLEELEELELLEEEAASRTTASLLVTKPPPLNTSTL